MFLTFYLTIHLFAVHNLLFLLFLCASLHVWSIVILNCALTGLGFVSGFSWISQNNWFRQIIKNLGTCRQATRNKQPPAPEGHPQKRAPCQTAHEPELVPSVPLSGTKRKDESLNLSALGAAFIEHQSWNRHYTPSYILPNNSLAYERTTYGAPCQRAGCFRVRLYGNVCTVLIWTLGGLPWCASTWDVYQNT